MTIAQAAPAHEIPSERPAGFWDGVARSYIPPAELTIDPSVRLSAERADDVDPVTAEVIRYALLNTNFEHAELIQRLCVSPVTMLTRDYQASVLTEDGDLVCLGANLQYFSTSHAMTVKWTLEHRSRNPGINPGDIYLSNDPYVGAPHQPVTAVYAPLFVGDEIFCWVANSMHLADVGGSVQGSFCITAADAWADPPSFPPIKLVENGALREDVEQLFARQSRVPPAVKMDLRAAIAGVTATRAGLVSIASARRVISCGMVAEKNSVWRSLRNMATTRLMSWMKPMSSMRSASSSTRHSTSPRRSALPRTRSSSRPGVATRTSTPLSSARTCPPIDTPPIASALRSRW